MYLSRLILNARNRRVQREIARPYQMHRSLMRSFPPGLDREHDRVLFRIETDPRTGILTVLLQSTLEPRWTWLHDDSAAGYLLPEHLLPPGVRHNPATKPFDLHLAPGQTLAFRLRANPTARRRLPDGKRRRIGLCREEEQRTWLERKGEQGGFRLVSARVTGRGDIGGSIRRDGKNHKLKLLAVQFDGLLQVTEPDGLRQTVCQGVGSGKGLGFGLLSLARPR
jgi:CRISPR system Cascade subunit CasE